MLHCKEHFCFLCCSERSNICLLINKQCLINMLIISKLVDASTNWELNMSIMESAAQLNEWTSNIKRQVLHTAVLSPDRFYETWVWEIRGGSSRESVYLLSHPGQSALASGSRAASQGGHSHSSWPRPGGRQRKTHPGSALRLYRSLTAPFRHTSHISESAVLTQRIATAAEAAAESLYIKRPLFLLVQIQWVH